LKITQKFQVYLLHNKNPNYKHYFTKQKLYTLAKKYIPIYRKPRQTLINLNT